MEKKNEIQKPVQLPEGYFCYGNCASPNPCIYWEPGNRDSDGRQYCASYRNYFYPSERDGCLCKRD